MAPAVLIVQHVIRLKDEEPVYQPSCPFQTLYDVENELQRMLDNGVISYDPYTNYNSPMITVRKRDNSVRTVNNFVRPNHKTLDENYDMPNARDLLNRVASGKFLSHLDLTKSGQSKVHRIQYPFRQIRL